MTLKLILSLILTLSLTLVFPAQGKTLSSQSLVGQALIKEGKKYYEKKDYPNAIHQFSKVLLVDPGNEEALQYLDKLGVKGGFYGHPNRKLSQIAELAQEVELYREEITQLDAEKTKTEQLAQSLKDEMQENQKSLQKVVSEKEVEKEALRRAFQEFQRQAEEQITKNTAAIRKYESTAARQGHQIVVLNTDLYSYKDRLNQKIEELKARDLQLKDIAEQVKTAQKEIENSKRDWREERITYEDKLLTIQEQLTKGKDTTAGTKVKNQESLRSLQDELRKRKLELGQLRDKLIFTEYRLAHRDSQLAYQENLVKELRSSLADLEQELPGLPAGDARPGTKAGEWNFSAIPVEDKAEFIKRQDRQIAQLKERLLTANQAVADLKKGDAELTADSRDELVQQIQDMKRQLRDKENALQERVGEYLVLEARFKDTQQQLQFVKETMQEREEEIQDLEEQLNRVLADFE